MIQIKKTSIVPNKLNNETSERSFKKNIEAEEYVGSDRYTTVKDELSVLYNNKCAFCETDITAGSYNHIEHYRPKSIYYWLAYSWDNLLLSCPKCNIKKSDNFEISNQDRANYSNEELADLHNKTSDYDSFEKPKLINPEQFSDEQLKTHFTFNEKGSIKAQTTEMEYTVNLCDLNRDTLIRKRFSILKEYVEYYNLSSKKTEQLQIIITKLEKSIENNEEYIAWKKFLLVIMKSLLN